MHEKKLILGFFYSNFQLHLLEGWLHARTHKGTHVNVGVTLKNYDFLYVEYGKQNSQKKEKTKRRRRFPRMVTDNKY
jgi:hypothetical protein